MTPSESRTDKQKAVDEIVRARVLRGIELLKEQYGENFANHINMRMLDLSDGECCVLGQLYQDEEPSQDQWHALWRISRYGHGADDGGYLRGLAILDGEVARDPVAFGFEISPGDDGDSWTLLTDIWTEELEDLRS